MRYFAVWRRSRALGAALVGVTLLLVSFLGYTIANLSGPPDPTFSAAALQAYLRWEQLRHLFEATAWLGSLLFLGGLLSLLIPPPPRG